MCGRNTEKSRTIFRHFSLRSTNEKLWILIKGFSRAQNIKSREILRLKNWKISSKYSWKEIKTFLDFFFNLFMKQENYNYYRLITVISFMYFYVQRQNMGLNCKVWIIIFPHQEIERIFILFSFICSSMLQFHSPWSPLFFSHFFFLLIKIKFSMFLFFQFKYNLTSKNICDSIHVFLCWWTKFLVNSGD